MGVRRIFMEVPWRFQGVFMEVSCKFHEICRGIFTEVSWNKLPGAFMGVHGHLWTFMTHLHFMKVQESP